MPRIVFVPDQKSVEVDDKTKILVAARKAGVLIRFACASCRCGTCAVRILEGADTLSPIKDDELKLLNRLNLATDGSIRLSCQSRVSSDVKVDLDFQDEYDSDIGFEEDDESV